MSQISMFDGVSPLKITKPVRLIELFAGYGAQALALKYLGVPFENYKISEWAIKSIQAYKDLHFGEDTTDYSKGISFNELVKKLAQKGISCDYNSPMSEVQIKRMGESKVRRIYNNIIASHNLVSVCNIHGRDLEITDTDKYTYIMTYSYPCQDLSTAGKRQGMSRNSRTRSGLLWEVERILDELSPTERPHILLMENVPTVVSNVFVSDFALWIQRLQELGYKSKWALLNGTDYGVPQNRNRCFMVSWRGDYYYDFPKPIKLEKKLIDLLEQNVDSKLYLAPEKLEKANLKHFVSAGGGWHQKLSELQEEGALTSTVGILLSSRGETIERITEVANTLCARDYKGFGNQTMTGVFEWNTK